MLQLEQIKPPPYAVGMRYEVNREAHLDHLLDYDLVKFAARIGTEIRLFIFARTLDLDPYLTHLRPRRGRWRQGA